MFEIKCFFEVSGLLATTIPPTLIGSSLLTKTPALSRGIRTAMWGAGAHRARVAPTTTIDRPATSLDAREIAHHMRFFSKKPKAI